MIADIPVLVSSTRGEIFNQNAGIDKTGVLSRNSSREMAPELIVFNTRSSIMYFDSDLEKLRRAQREAEREAAAARKKLAAARKAARAASGKAAKVTSSRSSSAHAIYTQHEEVGYTAEHAGALYYVRSLGLDEYVSALRPFAETKRGTTMLAIEYDAVIANFEKWTRRGETLHHENEVRAYEKDCEAFDRWQAENPDEKGWRELPATRRQYFLMWRTAMAQDIEYPRMTKRGVAHDWLTENGANLRLRQTVAPPPPPSQETSGE